MSPESGVIVIELHRAITGSVLSATTYLTKRELHLPLIHIGDNLVLLHSSPDWCRPVFVEHMRSS